MQNAEEPWWKKELMSRSLTSLFIILTEQNFEEKNSTDMCHWKSLLAEKGRGRCEQISPLFSGIVTTVFDDDPVQF